MSKTTPEEAIAIGEKYSSACIRREGHVVYFEITPEKLAALIDEVRGVDAEPVAIVCDGFDLRWVGSVPIAVVVRKSGVKIGDKLYTHPAPSQPAAPVELPVVAWFTDHLIGKKKKQLDIGDSTTNPDYRDAHKDWHWEPLVKLSDAQAAIAAGRKAS